MNIWHDIAPARVKPEDFWAVIEIEKGSKNKYEMDKDTGMLRLDRILYTSTHYPANYGFIPRTWADDGDPLDVLVLCSESIRPMSLVRCFPIGVITMEDGGDLDEKIIAIPFEDPPIICTRIFPSCPPTWPARSSTSSGSIRAWRARRPWSATCWAVRRRWISSSSARMPTSRNTASDIPRRHPRRWRRFFCGRETFSEGIASI